MRIEAQSLGAQCGHANLVRDLVVSGKTIAKAGAPAKGKVSYAKSSGRLHAPGQLTIRLTSIQLANGKILPLSSSGFRARGKSHTKSNVTKIGGGAAAGAVIGGLAGGGKGALIGTAVGAGAGTGVAAATGKEEAVIHAETAITFTTTANAKAKQLETQAFRSSAQGHVRIRNSPSGVLNVITSVRS